MIFSFVFSHIFENQTFFPHTSILMKNNCWGVFKAYYQNKADYQEKKEYFFQIIPLKRIINRIFSIIRRAEKL